MTIMTMWQIFVKARNVNVDPFLTIINVRQLMTQSTICGRQPHKLHKQQTVVNSKNCSGQQKHFQVRMGSADIYQAKEEQPSTISLWFWRLK